MLLAPFGAVMAAALMYVFYASPLRNRIENKLYDIRIRVSPTFVKTSDVAVIAIDDASIAALDGPQATDLSFDALRRVTAAALQTRAKAVAVLIPPQLFSYRDPQITWTVGLAQRDRRLFLGTFDLTTKNGADDAIPEVLRPALDRTVKADIDRWFRREIVRDFVVKQDKELPYLPYVLTQLAAPGRLAEVDALPKVDGKSTVKLNYFDPGLLHQVRAEDLVKNPDAVGLDDRIVIIGYTTYRRWTAHFREATLVNSPWQVDGEDVEKGMPVVHVQAVALVNLLRGIWLHPVPTWVNVLHVLLLAGATLLIWRFSVGFAAFLFIGGWSLLLLVHALVIAGLSIYVPLADGALVSSLTMVGGALWRLSVEGRLRALHEARASSEAELAAVQDRFLNRFAFELAAINGKARAALERHAALKEAPGPMREAFVRALGSCEELDDYLLGIQQFASLPSLQGAAAPETELSIDVMDVIDKVLCQFESRLSEARLTIALHGDRPLFAVADRTLTSQIVYNLVSNAAKYSPAGAAITVHVAREGSRIVIRVKDEGPGIATEFHERIFEKFYRVKDDRVYKLKGHGLGLYLSRYFANQIGATIAVRSSPGHGAEFTLSLKGAP